MTPFGQKLRELRAHQGLTQQQLAQQIGVTPAYLSALEHGHRGRPSFYLIQRIIGVLGIIWDEAEELTRLARLSHPKITIDTSGLSSEATELTNVLADKIETLSPELLQELLALLKPDEVQS
ncbi:MAG: helix-turn-helix domain-containing protein [Parvibaculaceae bacterium]|nr:helix-turn-helix domain-containing protein [Parvibaculaceae bacterium]